MRILIANDGFADAGGVQTYLDAVGAGLVSRGHEISMLYLDPAPIAGPPSAVTAAHWFSVSRDGADRTFQLLREWKPDVGFSHNMSDLTVDRRLLSVAPVVKFMHGYAGTCIGGQKMFGLPLARPCSRTFGPACLGLYFPRRCGLLSVSTLVHDYRWASEQRDLFNHYHSIVVASEHMRREYVRGGADERKVHVDPLFSQGPDASDRPLNVHDQTVVFLGRMTRLKGGDVLIRAAAEASSRLPKPIELLMVGDGPQRAAWERLAAALHVRSTFAGWRSGAERRHWLRRASLLAVSSTWPEPFGLVGLEAGALGIPAIAFDVGGIREWLEPGENGYLIPADPPRASAFADGLVAAFRDPEALCAMRAKSHAKARRMSLERHLAQLERILSEAGTAK